MENNTYWNTLDSFSAEAINFNILPSFESKKIILALIDQKLLNFEEINQQPLFYNWQILELDEVVRRRKYLVISSGVTFSLDRCELKGQVTCSIFTSLLPTTPHR